MKKAEIFVAMHINGRPKWSVYRMDRTTGGQHLSSQAIARVAKATVDAVAIEVKKQRQPAGASRKR